MIALDGGGEGLRPGMSCNIEILVEDLTNVLFVPRQCVFFDGRETVVFLREAGETTRRVVRVGQDNAQWVMIEEGLKEGDVVLLAPPSDFKPEGVSPGAPEDGPAAEKVEGSPAGGASGRSPGGSRGGYSGAGGARASAAGGRGSSAGSGKSAGGRPSGAAGGRPSGAAGGRPSGAKSSAGTGGRPSGSSSGGARSGQAAGKGGK